MSSKSISERLAAIRAKQHPGLHKPTARPAAPTGCAAPRRRKAAPAKAKAPGISRETPSARAGAVLAGSAAKGRERQAEALLLASCDPNPRFVSAEAIIAELARRPTDAEMAKALAIADQEKIARGWSKAVGEANALAGHGAEAGSAADPHGWAKAVEFANGRGDL